MDKQLQVFKNELFEVSIKLENGEFAFDAETVAKSLGIVQTKNDMEYVRWERVNEYLKNSPQVGKGDFIPESAVYKLAFKASNEVAEKFQDWLAIEVLPQIRKTGQYIQPQIDSKFLYQIATQLEEKEKQIQTMQPKADYFDALVDRVLLTNFRDSAKELGIKEGMFIQWLNGKYLYRDQSDKLKPYAKYVPDLFKLKEWTKNGKAGNQPLITPKGRATFRLLLIEDGLIKA
jgi:phage antirepressor YoqD-like protein